MFPNIYSASALGRGIHLNSMPAAIQFNEVGSPQS
jgi:hypothetical protein